MKIRQWIWLGSVTLWPEVDVDEFECYANVIPLCKKLKSKPTCNLALCSTPSVPDNTIITASFQNLPTATEISFTLSEVCVYKLPHDRWSTAGIQLWIPQSTRLRYFKTALGAGSDGLVQLWLLEEFFESLINDEWWQIKGYFTYFTLELSLSPRGKQQ